MKNRILFLTMILVALSSCTEETTETGVENSQEVAADTAAMEVDYIATGKMIIKSTFKALSGQLKAQIMDGGPEQALSFCNVNAVSLTDSLSKEFGATIQRVTIDYRNPKNKAVGFDVTVFESYEDEIENGQDLKPRMHFDDNDQAVFYAPIVLKPQCVICHGQRVTEIENSTLAKINELYPEDTAIGYSAGDLRGLWKISFNK